MSGEWWVVEERTDWENGATAIAVRTIHAREIVVGATTFVVVDLLHYSPLHQDWTITVSLHEGSAYGPPRPWYPVVHDIPLPRRFLRFVLSGDPDRPNPDDPMFPIVWRADLAAGSWWLLLRNRAGKPTDNSYWLRVVALEDAS